MELESGKEHGDRARAKGGDGGSAGAGEEVRIQLEAGMGAAVEIGLWRGMASGWGLKKGLRGWGWDLM